jgi:hypothetical protein
MKFWKVVACVAGGVGAILAAPVVLPAATVGAIVAGVTAAGTAVAAAGTAVATTAAGSAVIGAATTAGTAIATTAATAGTAIASTSVGTAVIGAATTAGTVATGVAATAGTAVIGAATTAGTAIASTSVGGAVIGAGSGIISSAAAATSLTEAAVVAYGTMGVCGTYSAATAGEGISNVYEADALIESSKKEYEKAKNILDEKIQRSNKLKEDLNKFKVDIYSKDINGLIDIINKIKFAKDQQIDYLDGKKIIYLDDTEISNMKATALTATEIMSQVSHGVNFAAAAASGTLAFASQFGVASTGTAISGLSGAAATNATFAWLGGGAIVAGGGGMALGTVVLGGITILPATMLMSWNYAKHSEKCLTKAKEFYSKIVKECENIKLAFVALEGINQRIYEMYYCIQQLVDSCRQKVFVELIGTYQRNKNLDGKVEFKACSENDKANIKRAVYFLKKLKELIAIKVFDVEGKPSEESYYILNDIANDHLIQGVLHG